MLKEASARGSDFTKLDNKPCNGLRPSSRRLMKKFDDCNIQPRSVHTTISEVMGQTHMGVDADPVNLIFQGLKTALADYIGMLLQPIIRYPFGTPEPATTEANFGVMDPEMVNIAVHGHNPFYEMIVRVSRNESRGGGAGAKGIKRMGICCTGNEVLMRQGTGVDQLLPGAADRDRRPPWLLTCSVSCPIRAVAECYHARIISTMFHPRFPDLIILNLQKIKS